MTDRFSVRAIILIIGLVLIIALAGALLLAYQAKDVPEWLPTVVTGGLALLAPSPLSKATAGAQPVTVANSAADPVPVEEAAHA